MAIFTVGTYGYDGVDDLGGQSFTPNVPGDGSGSPGSATQVFVHTFSLGYPSASTTHRARTIYIYSIKLTDPDQIGQTEYLVAVSSSGSFDDGTGLFGSGTYQRTFCFSSGALVPGSKYYAYFDIDQVLRVNSNSSYTGGNAQDADLNDLPGECAQFQVEMYT